MKPYKPEGYSSVSPYFIVDDAQKLIDMIKYIFNGTEKRRYEMPDGSIMHAEVQLDDSIIMLGSSSEKYPANSVLLHVYVSNVDAIFEKAIQYGCTPVEKPKEQEGDPDRRGTFQDFAGNTWSIGTQL